MAASNDPIAPAPIHAPTPDHAVSVVRLLLWLAALVVGIVLLHRLGSGALSAPSWPPSTWTAWWGANDPLTAAMALLRVGVLGLGWYLLVVTVVTLLAAWSRAATAGRLLRVIAVRPLRDTMAALIGVAMVSATSTPATASSLHAEDVRTPVAVHLVTEEAHDHDADEPGAAPSDALRRLREGAGRFADGGGSRGRAEVAEVPPSVSRRSGEGPLRRDGGVPSTMPGDEAEADADAAVTKASDATDEHLVIAGESFWSIARDRLEQVGAPTDEVDVAAYWLVLIDANRDRLVVAGEPDLILPGQRLILPEVEATHTAEAGS